MMNKRPAHVSLLLLAGFVVLFPLIVWFGNRGLDFSAVGMLDIFPAFGLIAFAVMWLHIVGGALRTRLNKYIDFQKFVDITSIVVLIALILHPGLLFYALIRLGAGSPFDYTAPGEEYLIVIAVVAYVIFLGYDILKKYQGRKAIAKHWQKIKLVSTLAFFLSFWHSIGLGADLQSGPLKLVWWLMAITAAIATFYSYVYRPRKYR